MTDTVILPDHLERLAENMALGNVLSDWSDLPWDEVVDILETEGEDNHYTGVQDDRITVWEPFENHPPVFITEQLDSLKREFLSAMTIGYTAVGANALSTDERTVLGDLLFYTVRNADEDEDKRLYRLIGEKLFNENWTEEV
jgi:hypothetical protein